MPEVIGPVRPKVAGAFKVAAPGDLPALSALEGSVTDAQIPAGIMRDAEFTAVAVRGLLGLTPSEVNDLLTGAIISGQTLTFTQNDGTTVPIIIPTATPGLGDGVVASGVFNDDQTQLILTLDTGGTVSIDVPAALRMSAFSIHSILTEAVPTGADRLPFSDEGTAGDPNAYISWEDAVGLIRNVFTYTSTRPQASEDYGNDVAISAHDRSMDICLNVPHRTDEATGTFEAIVPGDVIQYVQEREEIAVPVLDRYYYGYFRDDFWVGTDVGGGRIELLQDVANDALASFLTNNANSVLWLHSHPSDASVLVQLTALPAGREVFYWNSTDLMIKKLDSATFVAAGSTTDHWQWLSLIPEAAVIVFAGHGRPQFDPDHVGQVAVNQGGREWRAGFEFVDHSTVPSWIEANLADVAWNRWLGSFSTGMSGLFSIIGSFEFRSNFNRFHQLDQNGNTVDRTWSELVDWFRANQTHIGNVPAGLIPLNGERSVFLSGPHIVFANDAEAAAYIAAEQITDSATKVFVWFTGDGGDVENWTFRWATVGGYVAGITDITEQLYWAGPLAIDEGGAGGEVTVTPTGGGSFSRTELTARNEAAASIGRVVRHLTLSTALADIDDDDDIEIILESTRAYRAINPQIRFRAKLLKDRVISTFAAGTSFSSSYSFVAADALKYMEFKITRGNSDDSNDFAHDNILVGRIGAGTTDDPEKIVIWSATDSSWGHYWVNRVQYGVAAASAGQQLGDGSVGGYYFGAFYQQAAAQPAFSGVPDNDGAWLGLGDWESSRGNAVDASSTDPVWIAYASGYIDSSNDVITANAPQVFAEFSTQYSNDGFSSITGAAPADPDGWWRRDILPGGGFTAPIPLFHTDNPWIPVWAEEDFYTRNGDGESKDIDLNLNNVTAIRFTLTPFGLWSDDGIALRPGAVCTDVMPRPPVGWSTSEFNDNARNSTGLYSVSYHESAGLQVHHQNDGSAADFNIPTGAYRDTDYPARAWACAMKFIAPNTNDLGQLTALRIFDSPQHYERFLWTIEVQRET